jgi:hypothetical protein
MDTQRRAVDTDEKRGRFIAWGVIVGVLAFTVGLSWFLDRWPEYGYAWTLLILMIILFGVGAPALYLLGRPSEEEGQPKLSTEERTLRQLERLTDEVRRLADAMERLKRHE